MAIGFNAEPRIIKCGCEAVVVRIEENIAFVNEFIPRASIITQE